MSRYPNPFLGEGWSYTIGDLPPGGISNFSMEMVIGEGLSGTITTEAMVTGRHGNMDVSASDSLVMEIIDIAKPEIKMQLSGPLSAQPGEMITFRFVIANSGTVALSGVKVTAPLFGRFLGAIRSATSISGGR